jgi:hypothetical protein
MDAGLVSGCLHVYQRTPHSNHYDPSMLRLEIGKLRGRLWRSHFILDRYLPNGDIV